MNVKRRGVQQSERNCGFVVSMSLTNCVCQLSSACRLNMNRVASYGSTLMQEVYMQPVAVGAARVRT
jgi:hypothetical protein